MNTRGELLLNAIYDDIDHKLNPSGDECPHCGGEGYTYDCIDGCCENADEGCEDCARKCVECVLFNGHRARAVREAVIAANDVDIAIAWLKQIGRWTDDITPERVRRELTEMAAVATTTDGAVK